MENLGDRWVCGFPFLFVSHAFAVQNRHDDRPLSSVFSSGSAMSHVFGRTRRCTVPRLHCKRQGRCRWQLAIWFYNDLIHDEMCTRQYRHDKVTAIVVAVVASESGDKSHTRISNAAQHETESHSKRSRPTTITRNTRHRRLLSGGTLVIGTIK